jgi:hypothetical protein
MRYLLVVSSLDRRPKCSLFLSCVSFVHDILFLLSPGGRSCWPLLIEGTTKTPPFYKGHR